MHPKVDDDLDALVGEAAGEFSGEAEEIGRGADRLDAHVEVFVLERRGHDGIGDAPELLEFLEELVGRIGRDLGLRLLVLVDDLGAKRGSRRRLGAVVAAREVPRE
ncbi:MAG: hypothetical protein IPN83_00105 [Holophagales bacterium]|nr:hypothetical protein [Holophagales bacterium]